jgi:tetratricopeptide (TPR) repeat protein
LDNPDEPLRCVFSTITEIKVGTGTTAKKQRNKLLWHVQQKDVDEFGIRKINPQFVPVGEEKIIDQEELLADYTPEVEIHNSRVEPAMCALRKTIAKGDKHRSKGEPLSAEMEYSKALDVDETNVRAVFGLGLVYLDRKDKEKSKAVFEQLVALEATFDLKHKHLFNEFGIALRKNELYDEAVKYYSRAVDLTSDDENLYYNLARAFYEKGDWEHCLEFVSHSLRLNPYLEHSLGLCRLMVALSSESSLCDKYGKPAVPEHVARQAGELLADDDGMAMNVELGSGGGGVDAELVASSVSFDINLD